MENDEIIDVSLKNIWKTWFSFRKGKKATPELDEFQYHLEKNLFHLFSDLNNGTYRHGPYRKFIVYENKKREISVAPIRDRVIHRLVYDYLVSLYDKTFIYDVWSCREGKGLIVGIERTQEFLRKNPQSFIWKADIRKFFDNVSHAILLKILFRKIKDKKAAWLLCEIIHSFQIRERERELRGIPIGNLTSQIFANIYLNELDRFVKHELKIKYYLRYGDDFIVIERDRRTLFLLRDKIINFLRNSLYLSLQNDFVFLPRCGLKFLGVIIYPRGRKLNRRNQKRLRQRLDYRNAGSYYGLIIKHKNKSLLKEFHWQILGNTLV